MYTRITRTGDREYLQLVESFREGGKVRKRVVANLGRLDKIKQKPGKLLPLANRVNSLLGIAEKSLLPEVKVVSPQSYGAVFALHELWHDLGIDKALKFALRSNRRSINAAALIKAMVFNRLCDPRSKLGCIEWMKTVAIPEMPRKAGHQQLLRSMDALMENMELVEKAIAEQMLPLVDAELTIVFYDLTTVRISGEKELEEDLRQYGKSKDTGGTARQFVLGVVQTAEGLPLSHMVHPGNVAETKTLKGMARTVLERFPIRRVVLVADRGLLSYENIDDLQALADDLGRDLEFILAVPSRRYGELAETFRQLDFGDEGDGADGKVQSEEGQGEDEEKLATSKFRGCRLVVAHDPYRARERAADRRGRIAKLQARAETFAKRTHEGAGRRISHDAALAGFAAEVRVARLKRYFRFGLDKDGRFFWSLNEKNVEEAELFDGKLALVTNVEDIDPEEVVARYKSLADIERGFRVLKSDIEIAPVFHWQKDRIRAHAMICFLALVLYRVLRMRLKARGLGMSPVKVIESLEKIRRFQARVGERTVEGVTDADKEQLELFDALNLKKPV